VRLRGDESQLAEIVRAFDAEQITIEQLRMHAPSLDDVFLAKTGRSLEGAGEDADEAAAAAVNEHDAEEPGKAAA
jgi:ABC-2 type transport system ATP-binding protein